LREKDGYETQQLLTAIRKVVRELGEGQGYSLILAGGATMAGVLSFMPAIDLTPQVMQRFDHTPADRPVSTSGGASPLAKKNANRGMSGIRGYKVLSMQTDSRYAPTERGLMASVGLDASRSHCHDGVLLMTLYVLLQGFLLFHSLAASGLLLYGMNCYVLLFLHRRVWS
jgi:hypothetical protein